jgi:outer membrane protein OmpA-like peptidoglycan-associated protein
MKNVVIILFALLSFLTTYAQPRFVKERADYDGEEVMKPFYFSIQSDDHQLVLNPVGRISGRLDTGELEVISLDGKSVDAYPYRELKGAILAKNYLPYFFHLFPMDVANAQKEVVMMPISEGATFVAEGIVFLGDNTNIYFSSVDALQSLLEFMNMHPSVRVRIIGHVNANAETKLSDTQLIALAKKRAENIQDYLINHGVSKHRLSTMGRGREAVKYPNPQTEEELEFNRRVEIEVIGF